jgi:hypothetical protein
VIEIGAPLEPAKLELAPRILRSQVSPFFGLVIVMVAISELLAGVTGWTDGLAAGNVTPPDVEMLTEAPEAQPDVTLSRNTIPARRLRFIKWAPKTTGWRW